VASRVFRTGNGILHHGTRQFHLERWENAEWLASCEIFCPGRAAVELLGAGELALAGQLLGLRLGSPIGAGDRRRPPGP